MIKWLKDSEEKQKKENQQKLTSQKTAYETDSSRLTEKIDSKQETISELQQRILDLQLELTDKVAAIS